MRSLASRQVQLDYGFPIPPLNFHGAKWSADLANLYRCFTQLELVSRLLLCSRAFCDPFRLLALGLFFRKTRFLLLTSALFLSTLPRLLQSPLRRRCFVGAGETDRQGAARRRNSNAAELWPLAALTGAPSLVSELRVDEGRRWRARVAAPSWHSRAVQRRGRRRAAASEQPSALAASFGWGRRALAGAVAG